MRFEGRRLLGLSTVILERINILQLKQIREELSNWIESFNRGQETASL